MLNSLTELGPRVINLICSVQLVSLCYTYLYEKNKKKVYFGLANNLYKNDSEK